MLLKNVNYLTSTTGSGIPTDLTFISVRRGDVWCFTAKKTKQKNYIYTSALKYSEHFGQFNRLHLGPRECSFRDKQRGKRPTDLNTLFLSTNKT